MTCDELFLFAESYGDYALVRYLQNDNPDITEAEIPGVHNGRTVRLIEQYAFMDSPYLRSVIIPESVREIESSAFCGCPNLPPETVMTCLTHSRDHTRDIEFDMGVDFDIMLREDVFKLSLDLKNWGTCQSLILNEIVNRGLVSYLEMTERAGILDREALDELFDDIECYGGSAEAIAWLMEYKNRKFGFNGGNEFEI